MKKISIYLCRHHPNIDHRDLMSEGVIAIKQTRTTCKIPHKVNYLIKRAKLSMKRFIFSELSLTGKAIPLDEVFTPQEL